MFVSVSAMSLTLKRSAATSARSMMGSGISHSLPAARRSRNSPLRPCRHDDGRRLAGTAYSYFSASRMFRRPARRAGKIAATRPAITAATMKTISVPHGIVNAG